jgi:hypothetical protein
VNPLEEDYSSHCKCLFFTLSSSQFIILLVGELCSWQNPSSNKEFILAPEFTYVTSLIVGIGIYLIILGAVHLTFGCYTVNHCLSICVELYFTQWRKKPASSSQDKYGTGMNQPQQNNAAASDNATKAQQESANKTKAKETTNNQQEPPQDNQAADYNISLSVNKKGAKTKKGYELDEEEL